MNQPSRFTFSRSGLPAPRPVAAFAVAASLLASDAGAVIVAGDPGQDAPLQTTAPVGFEDAWNRVGSLGGGSGVYLGNGYVLSARHVGGGNNFSIDGVNHERIAGTSITLTNPEGLGLSTQADLWINRYAIPDTSPLVGLGVIEIRDTPLETAGGGGIIIGEGLGQTTQSPVNVGGSRTGYIWGGSEVRRWGDIGITGAAEEIQAGGRDVVGAVSFSFQEIAGRGAAAAGDSGGGLFYMDNGTLVLAGITHAVTLFNDQNEDTTAFGNRTLFSDLSVYLDQIHVVQGDLTGDGFVGVEDLDLILANWGTAVTAGDWTQGDANGDGTVDQGDLDAVLPHFGMGTPSSQVPEPGTAAAMVLLGTTLTARRRRPRRLPGFRTM
ncbi:MAG: PEP-CTERM sorting domain-containing protein [Phycisphaerales bacterium JB063]